MTAEYEQHLEQLPRRHSTRHERRDPWCEGLIQHVHVERYVQRIRSLVQHGQGHARDVSWRRVCDLTCGDLCNASVARNVAVCACIRKRVKANLYYVPAFERSGF